MVQIAHVYSGSIIYFSGTNEQNVVNKFNEVSNCLSINYLSIIVEKTKCTCNRTTKVCGQNWNETVYFTYEYKPWMD